MKKRKISIFLLHIYLVYNRNRLLLDSLETADLSDHLYNYDHFNNQVENRVTTCIKKPEASFYDNNVTTNNIDMFVNA